MKRVVLLFALSACILVAGAAAEDLSGRWGLGMQFGLQKLVGGDRDYSNADQDVGLWLRRGLSPRWSLEGAVRYGYVRPGALAGEDAGLTFESVHAFYTTLLHGAVGVRYQLAPASRLAPYLSLHGGYLDWRVRDENGVADVGPFPDGPVVVGYDTNGRRQDLRDRNLTATFGLGLECFLGRRTSLELGARYTAIFGNDLDNVGTGNIFGPGHVDANTGLLVGGFGLTIHFGGNQDKDADGILNAFDACPEEAEDVDGFQDADGCPDPDNDGDGFADVDDNCPDDAEDRDGYKDADGCPDPDNDGDGVIDTRDACPDEAEDLDGYQDDDGCPDPDNDGDGVADATDRCPDTPAGAEVDATGCAVAAEIKPTMVLKGVTFETDSDELQPASASVLDDVVASLMAWPEAMVEIQGHTDSQGSAEHNRDLSARRARSVRQYLIARGIVAGRLTAVGYGEAMPIADNGTIAGRAANRRVELVRTDR